jgi:hypothetical protein
MSEFQYVAFRAIDGPVSDKNLDFMRKQSSRAEVTPWQFENEYHYGDFHGNAAEMLCRGYDLHLHYANFGIRRLMIRLPSGLPDPEAAKAYFVKESLEFLKDKKGPGGILSIEPAYEPGHLDDLWDLSGLFDRLVPLRAEVQEGDLRPLYLCHLALRLDSYHDPDEVKEAPVPGGLAKLTKAQRALADLYGLAEDLIAAAARNSPALPAPTASENELPEWLARQPEATKNAWLVQLLADPHTTLRAEILTDFRASKNIPSWPTVRLDRTIAELEAEAEKIGQKADHKAAEKAAKARVKKLAGMAADPMKTIAETEKLVKERRRDAYEKIAELLADLREALAGGAQADLAEQHALALWQNNPKLTKLLARLRGKGFLPKRRAKHDSPTC